MVERKYYLHKLILDSFSGWKPAICISLAGHGILIWAIIMFAGDISEPILNIARKYYGNRLPLKKFDACKMPFTDNSKDVIIIFEAIYYLPDIDKFIDECTRVLRPDGEILIATANKDLPEFNPSPYSHN